MLNYFPAIWKFLEYLASQTNKPPLFLHNQIDSMLLTNIATKRYAIQRKTPENDGFPIYFGNCCVLKFLRFANYN